MVISGNSVSGHTTHSGIVTTWQFQWEQKHILKKQAW
jgi:hypothetical protein